jgi:hypothetical protein
MSAKNLKIDQLELDLLNPRISSPIGQQEAMQQILDDQGAKLGNLAESIVEDGLNPMDRLLVMKSETATGKYTVLEGNRRAFVLRVLKNPNVLTGLTLPSSLQKKLEKLAQGFDTKTLEPIACYEVDSRLEGTLWIEQRHIGEDEGRGIVRWSGVAASRFRGQAPAIQALDFVRQHAKLTDDQKKLLEGRFPITTLDRLLSTPAVRLKIGFDVKDNKLLTALPADEAIKPLRRIVLDLAEKTVNVTKLKLKPQQVDYVSKLDPADTPDLKKKTTTTQAVQDFTQKDFSAPPQPKAKKAKAQPKTQRTTAIPKTCRLNIPNPKIEEISTELRILQLSKHPHAIAVLLRVLLETSIDDYLTKASISLTTPVAGQGPKDKSLRKKVEEAIDHMVANGATRKDFAGVIKGLSDPNHPFSVDLLHAYVHNRFFSPSERDLRVAWDNGQPLFEKMWP